LSGLSQNDTIHIKMDKIHVDFWQMELNKLIDILDSTQNIRLRLGIFFGIINLTGLTLAFILKVSSLILLSASTMVLFIFADFLMIRTMYGYYYRAIRILTQKFNYGEESIFDMFMLFLRIDKIKIIHLIAREEDNITRYKQLRRLPFKHPTVMGFWSPLLLLIVESLVAYYLFRYHGWVFF